MKDFRDEWPELTPDELDAMKSYDFHNERQVVIPRSHLGELFCQKSIDRHELQGLTRDDADKYIEHIKRDLAHQMVSHLLKEGVIKFTQNNRIDLPYNPVEIRGALVVVKRK